MAPSETAEPKRWTAAERVLRLVSWIALALAVLAMCSGDPSGAVVSALVSSVCDLGARHSRDMRFTRWALVALDRARPEAYLRGWNDASAMFERLIQDQVNAR